MPINKEKKKLRSRILQSFLQPFRKNMGPISGQPDIGFLPKVGFSMLKGLEAAQQTTSPEEGLAAGIAAGLFGPTELRSIMAEREQKKQASQRAKISLIPDSAGNIHKVTMDPITGDVLSNEIIKDIKKTTKFDDKLLNLAEQEAYGVEAGTRLSQVKGKVPVAPAQRVKLAELAKAIPILSELRRGIATLDLAESIPTTAFKGPLLASQSLSPASKAGVYNAKKKAFLAQLSRASGERGVLTDQDIARIENNIPGFFDTKESSEEKLASIERVLNEIQAKAESALVGSPFSKGKPRKERKIGGLSDKELLLQLEEAK